MVLVESATALGGGRGFQGRPGGGCKRLASHRETRVVRQFLHVTRKLIVLTRHQRSRQILGWRPRSQLERLPLHVHVVLVSQSLDPLQIDVAPGSYVVREDLYIHWVYIGFTLSLHSGRPDDVKGCSRSSRSSS